MYLSTGELVSALVARRPEVNGIPLGQVHVLYMATQRDALFRNCIAVRTLVFAASIVLQHSHAYIRTGGQVRLFGK